jgi:hypothetical protein
MPNTAKEKEKRKQAISYINGTPDKREILVNPTQKEIIHVSMLRGRLTPPPP